MLALAVAIIAAAVLAQAVLVVRMSRADVVRRAEVASLAATVAKIQADQRQPPQRPSVVPVGAFSFKGGK